MAACGGGEGIDLSPTFGALPLDEQVRRVLTIWESPLPRLLVFDNCEDETLLDQWRPKHGGCRVLLTSRRHHWSPALGVQPVPLNVLPRLDSLALLRTFCPDIRPADPNLHAIADALGDLPLALHLAGSFLAKYRYVLTPAQYLQRIHVPTILDDRSLQQVGLSPTKHVQHVARTFEQSYAQLDPADPTDVLARTLLAHAAYFALGEPLPRWLLLETLDLPDEDADCGLLAEDALMRVIDLGLLEIDEVGTLRLHRLLLAFVRAVVGSAAVQRTVEATMLRVAHRLNTRVDSQPLIALQPHLRFITEAAQARADARTADLCTALGVHVQYLGAYAAAQGYFERALAIREQVLGSDHADTAWSLSQLGDVLFFQGKYVQARTCHEHALAIQERVLGSDHADTVWSLSQLGRVLRFQGEYTQAQTSVEQALAIQERLLGIEYRTTTPSLAERALAVEERLLGMEYPTTLGTILYAQGEYAQARTYFEGVLALRERALGHKHSNKALILNSLGLVLLAQEDVAGARDCFERALALQRGALGYDHPATAGSLNGLGFALLAQGEVTGAQRYFEQALAIFEQRLGPLHPESQAVRRRLVALDPYGTAPSGPKAERNQVLP